MNMKWFTIDDPVFLHFDVSDCDKLELCKIMNSMMKKFFIKLSHVESDEIRHTIILSLLEIVHSASHDKNRLLRCTWKAMRNELQNARICIRLKTYAMNEEPFEVSGDETKDMFEKALKDLKNDGQELINRYYFYDQNVEDIAFSMNLSADTIYKRLQRIRQKLRKNIVSGNPHAVF